MKQQRIRSGGECTECGRPLFDQNPNEIRPLCDDCVGREDGERLSNCCGAPESSRYPGMCSDCGDPAEFTRD
jgi:hypothetical protein